MQKRNIEDDTVDAFFWPVMQKERKPSVTKNVLNASSASIYQVDGVVELMSKHEVATLSMYEKRIYVMVAQFSHLIVNLCTEYKQVESLH